MEDDAARELAWRRIKDEANANRVRAMLTRRYGVDADTLYLAVSAHPLHERERDVCEMRLRHAFTLEECGRVLGVTRERVRQIEAKIVRKYGGQ